jgi:hypothetical protein
VPIQYRTPTQLGLPERFHRTLKEEEVYVGGRSIQIPKWQGSAKGAKEKLHQMLAAQAG